jgi:hypothetical protein
MHSNDLSSKIFSYLGLQLTLAKYIHSRFLMDDYKIINLE